MEIQVALVRARMSGRELARRLGVSQTWVSTRLNGTTPLDLNDLQRIADAIGVSVADLIPRTGGDGSKTALTRLTESTTPPQRHTPVVPGRPFGPPKPGPSRPQSAIPATRRRPRELRPPNRPTSRPASLAS